MIWSPQFSKLVFFLARKSDGYAKTWIFFLKQERKVFAKFQIFKNFVKVAINKKIRALRMDRGGKYLSKNFNAFCEHCGIKQQLILANTLHKKQDCRM
jgi:hypothetical protein